MIHELLDNQTLSVTKYLALNERYSQHMKEAHFSGVIKPLLYHDSKMCVLINS